VIVSSALHPNYREVLKTYAWASDIRADMIPTPSGVTESSAIRNMIDDDTAAIVIQSPNFFGCIENIEEISAIAREKKIRLIVVINEMLSLGLLKGPGDQGADVICGEAQSFGNYTGFGGPLLGFISAKKEFLRRLPGRLVGKTVDADGRDAYVLTLQTREQHIRREKATSNICSNEGLLALRTVIYLSMLGPKLAELARLNHHNAGRIHEGLAKAGFEPVFKGPFFNEFVVKKPGMSRIIEELKNKGIMLGYDLAGTGLADCVLVCATEIHTDAAIDELLKACGGLK
jgi:glycine dehydrogenase subunit 1